MENRLYVKIIDGISVKKQGTNCSWKKNGLMIINPTDEMLFEQYKNVERYDFTKGYPDKLEFSLSESKSEEKNDIQFNYYRI